MSSIWDQAAGTQPRFNFQEFVPFKSLENLDIYILARWTHQSQYGPETTFVFAIEGKQVPVVLATSTSATVPVKQLEFVQTRGLLPQHARLVKVVSEKAQSGYIWKLVASKADADTRRRLENAARAAEASDETLPDDLPF